MIGNIPPFFTTYGPASATQPGILTTSAQPLKGPKTALDPFTVSQSASLSGIGNSRYLLLKDLAGSTNGRTEIGLGFPGATYQPVVVGYITTSNTGSTKGDWYVATRDVTTDTAPAVALWVRSASVIEGVGPIRSIGTATLPATAGISMYYNAGATTGTVEASLPGTNYKALNLDGLSVSLRPNGTTAFYSDATRSGSLSGMANKVTVVTGAGPTALNGSDHLVILNPTATATQTVNLDPLPVAGQRVSIKDGKGIAGANAITVSGNGKNIDGAASFSITTNWASFELVYNGTQWNTLSAAYQA